MKKSELFAGDHIIFKNRNGEWCVSIVDEIIHEADGTHSFTITKNWRDRIYAKTLKHAKAIAKQYLKFNYYTSVGYHVFKLFQIQEEKSYKAL